MVNYDKRHRLFDTIEQHEQYAKNKYPHIDIRLKKDNYDNTFPFEESHLNEKSW